MKALESRKNPGPYKLRIIIYVTIVPLGRKINSRVVLQ
jgi:hypothetical protein